MIRKPRVYVAGPLSKDVIGGTAKAMEVGTRLLDDGFAPYVPHLSTFWCIAQPRPYETWMELDFAWIEACDALLRLEGESAGADREVLHAVKLGIPVFYSLDTLYAWKWTWRG